MDGAVAETRELTELVSDEGVKELPKETLDFFSGDEIRARVFYEKYALRDPSGKMAEKTPGEMWDRIAQEISGAESTNEKKTEWSEKFRWLLYDFRFVPGGRIMFGAGQGRRSSLLNCYVIPVKEDSIEAIFDWCKEAARTYSLGGGVGTDISVLRPRGAPVNNSAVHSSGSVSFMNIMSETTHTIGQSGRRGALMITISVDHPDVLEFIKVKRNLRSVRYANISVKITDEFMKAVEADKEFTLRYDNKVIGRVQRKVMARELWDELVKSARDWAEPGLIFWDTVKRYSPSEYNGMEVLTTNPCVVAGTPVLTPFGWKPVESLKIGDSIITAYGTAKQITETYVYDDQDVYRVKFTDGAELVATGGHIFHSREGRAKDRVWSKYWNNEKKLGELKPGDMIRVPGLSVAPNSDVDTWGIPNREYGFMIGTLLGDGCYTPKIVARGHAKIASDYREREWNDRVIHAFRRVSENITVTSSSGNGCYILLQKRGTQFILNNTLLKPAMSFDKEIPVEYINSNKEFHQGIIDGLFSTDGNMSMEKTNPTLRLASSSKKLLDDVRSILLFYGIHGRIYKRARFYPHRIGGREITHKHDAYTLYIYGHGLAQFAATFSLSHPDKQRRLEKMRDISIGTSPDFAKIKSIEYVGKARVYDIYEKETDTWITNGFVSRGCSEQPLQPYGACDLGSINLSAFVENQFSDNAALDWKTLEKAVRYAVRFLDNILDYNMEKHALAAQKEACRQSRRIGIGVTGLADMFVKLKIKYDSDKALAFADNLFNQIKRAAYDESCEIAREKGSFPAFDKGKHLNMEFIKGLDADIRDKIAEYGLRNVAILTIPPVGSGSVLVGTSSGIEPIFAFGYTRRSESLSQEYFKVYHPLVSEYMKLAGIKDEKDLPDFFVPSHKIMPEFRVKMQGIIQRHIDSAISSTVNLAKDATVEQVGQIYMQAWKANCKGITVYREGSREGILITDEEQKLKEARERGWNRPEVMVGKTIKMKVMQGTLYLTANFDKTSIKEVFITVGKAGSDEKSYCEAIGRVVSRYLQLGGDVRDVIASLKGIRSSSVMWDHGLRIYSIPDAIAKALELATGQGALSPDAEAPTLAEKAEHKAKSIQVQTTGGVKMDTCPSCGEPTLANESGCVTCKSCGYTRCE